MFHLSHETLSHKFYQYFDQSIYFNFLKTFQESKKLKLQELGSGCDLICYRNQHLTVAFTKHFSQVTCRKWLQALKTLKRQQIPLIPPFETIEFKGVIAFISLYGDTEVHPHWLPLQSQIDKTYDQIDRLGLTMYDTPQIRAVQGVPFIFDLSDLRPKD